MPRRFRNLVGPRIREFREKMGLTQDHLAARLQNAGLENFDRVVVAKVESQIRSVFDFEAIILANVLKRDLSEILGFSHAEVKSALPDLLKGHRGSK